MDKRALRAALAAQTYIVEGLGSTVEVQAVDIYAALEAATINLPKGAREVVLCVTTPVGTRHRGTLMWSTRYGWAITKMEDT